MSRRPPRAYFSFRSPFSWMALRRLRACLPTVEDQIDLIPYWDPDDRTAAGLAAAGGGFHYAPMSKAKHLYILQDTKRLARRLRLTMVWPVDRDPWWEVPHLAWLKARRLGHGRVLYDALVAARWEQGRDICQPDVLAEVAAGIGLGDLGLPEAVDDDHVRAESVDCLLSAYHDDVFGIPYFIAGPHRFWGFDRVDDFVAHLAQLDGQSAPGPGRPALSPVDVPPYDTDTAGGCG